MIILTSATVMCCILIESASCRLLPGKLNIILVVKRWSCDIINCHVIESRPETTQPYTNLTQAKATTGSRIFCWSCGLRKSEMQCNQCNQWAEYLLPGCVSAVKFVELPEPVLLQMSCERREREDTVSTLLSLYHHCKDQGEAVSLGLETSQGDHYLTFSLRTRNNKQNHHHHHDHHHQNNSLQELILRQSDIY